VMYSKTNCPYCRDAKSLLKDHLGDNYSAIRLIELDQAPNPIEIGQALHRLTAMKTVPNIFISGKHVGGNEELQHLNRQGQLKPMLQEAGLCAIRPRDRIPATQVRIIVPDGDGAAIRTIDSSKLFEGKKVVMFGVPAAFSPSCSERHLPGFLEKREDFAKMGVDEIVCVSVNDGFVMKAWAMSKKAVGKITVVADGNGELIAKMGLLVDATKGGMGFRGRRFAAVVKDGVVQHIAIDKPMQTDESTAEKILPAMAKL